MKLTSVNENMTKLWHHWVTDRYCRSHIAVAVTACYTVATRSLQLHHSHNCEQRLRPIVVLLTLSRWTLVTCPGKLRVASRPHSSKCHSIKGCRFVHMGHCITTNAWFHTENGLTHCGDEKCGANGAMWPFIKILWPLFPDLLRKNFWW